MNSDNDVRIELVTNEIELGQYAARCDYATVTGQELVERPFWYEDKETKRLYHDLYGCIGWPSEVKEGDLGLPGYAAIIAVVRPHNRPEHYNPVDAKFLILEETETIDVPTLLDACVSMRKRWGFGVRPGLMSVWYGDPDRFIRPMALKNEWLTKFGGEDNALLITPPDDYYMPKVFDLYTRALQSVLLKKGDNGSVRLYFGGHSILKNRLEAFRREDPAVIAAGGLIHSLLSRTMWMDEMTQPVFTVATAGEEI